jgi:hypothetical protein
VTPEAVFGCDARLAELADSRAAAILKRHAWHAQRCRELEEEAAALREAAHALVAAKAARRAEVLERWRMRQTVRTLRAAAEIAEPLTTPARSKPIRPGRVWVAEQADRLLQIAAPINPALSAPGVYILFDGPTVSYVGQALNVLLRVGQHVGVKQFQRAAFIPCAAKELDRLERALIDVFLPRDNRDGRTKVLRRAGSPLEEFAAVRN